MGNISLAISLCDFCYENKAFYVKYNTSLKIPQRLSETVNRGGTDKIITKHKQKYTEH